MSPIRFCSSRQRLKLSSLRARIVADIFSARRSRADMYKCYRPQHSRGRSLCTALTQLSLGWKKRENDRHEAKKHDLVASTNHKILEWAALPENRCEDDRYHKPKPAP